LVVAEGGNLHAGVVAGIGDPSNHSENSLSSHRGTAGINDPGTSPCKPALLEPARALGRPITAGAIRYALRDGSVADEVCYWRDMTLLPHLINLFTKREILAEISFAEARQLPGDRKSITRQLHDEVQSLLAR
jgi:hypothetical protein